jgi:hypothetical protein
MPASDDANSAQGTLCLAVPRHCISLRSTPGFDQTGEGYQQDRDLPSNSVGTNLGHPGNAGQAGPQSGGSDMVPNFPWMLGPNMAYPSQDFNFQFDPIPSNPSIPFTQQHQSFSQQHQWGTGYHNPMNNFSQNNFGAPPFLDTPRYTNTMALAHPAQQSQSSVTTRNGQSSLPAPGTLVVDGG